MRTQLLVAVITLTMLITSANAEQQKWATTYLGWQFAGSAPNAWMVDQEVWIPTPGIKNYFTVNWNFTSSNNGYLGIQPDQGAGGRGSARFSIWNSLGARNGVCSPYDHEGSGYSCTADFNFDPDKFYRLRLWRLERTSGGQWWGAWLIEQDASNRLVEHRIGDIQTQPGNTEIRSSSLLNFSEYWGDSVSQCKDVSMSVVGWYPPGINYHGKGTGVYGAVAATPVPSTPAGNICRSGTEPDGAFHRHLKSDLGKGIGSVIILGGTKKENGNAARPLSGRDDGVMPLKRPKVLPPS